MIDDYTTKMLQVRTDSELLAWMGRWAESWAVGGVTLERFTRGLDIVKLIHEELICRCEQLDCEIPL